MGTRERADLVAARSSTGSPRSRTPRSARAAPRRALGYLASVLDRTSGAAEDPEQAKDIDHDVVNAMAVEVLSVHTALRRRT